MILTPLKDQWYIIVNPNAGNGKGKKDWTRIKSLLEKNGLVFEAKFTERKGHAIEIAREAAILGFRKIATVGGDGTLNEAINGIFTQNTCPQSEFVIGIIPVGTGNDWGRMLGIPLVYDGAIKALRENKTMKHDVGLVSFYIGEKPEKRYFINIAGLGFEAIVVNKTNRKKDKGRSNRAIYLFNLLSSLLSYKKINAEVTVDGQSVSCNIFSINIGNGRYCGGGMRQTPDAIPDDGQFDVTIIKDMSRLEVIKSIELLYDGTILSHEMVDGYRGSSIKVTSENLMYAEADGESLGHTPVEFSIIPSGINVIYVTQVFR